MKGIIISLLLLLYPIILTAQEIKILEFTLVPDEDLLNQPVSIDLSGLNYHKDSSHMILYRIEGNEKIRVPSQLERGYCDRLWFVPGLYIKRGEKVIFEVHRLMGDELNSNVNVMDGPEDIQILAGEKEILSYRHAVTEAPAGTNPLYRRQGGYIHPLKSPEGKILTCIQPPDHYHHYGIWNPWTRVVFKGRSVDFWNLAEGQGTVKFAGLVATYSGELFGGLKVRHEHVDFSAKGEDKIVMNELWDVRAWDIKLEEQPIWIIDFVFTLNGTTDSTIELAQYRYGGGIGYRATGEWTNKNSSVLTSEGKTRKDADASHARWCIITGETGQGQTSGLVFMSHSANRSHPEPMRIWPEDANNGRGDLFFEFCPIRHHNWIIHPGKEYVLKYRVVVFDGTINAETAEKLWRNYVYPPEIIKNSIME